MQMFIAFNPDDGYHSKKILTYISHCLNAEIHEGNIDAQNGLIFIFRDELHPFVFGGKRRYTSDDEDAVAEEIQKGKAFAKLPEKSTYLPLPSAPFITDIFHGTCMPILFLPVKESMDLIRQRLTDQTP